MTKTLTLSTGSFDQINTFMLAVEVRGKVRTFPASLHQGYHKQDDGVFWAMKQSACLKSHYTDADRAETARLRAETPVKHGDTVQIGDALYTVRVLGDYSDAAVFDKA